MFLSCPAPPPQDVVVVWISPVIRWVQVNAEELTAVPPMVNEVPDWHVREAVLTPTIKNFRISVLQC